MVSEAENKNIERLAENVRQRRRRELEIIKYEGQITWKLFVIYTNHGAPKKVELVVPHTTDI